MQTTQEKIEKKDRVRKNTSEGLNKKVDLEIAKNIHFYESKSKEEITQRINELEKEWSIERRIETFASSLILSSGLLAWFVNKKWLALTGVVAGFLLQHGVQGWCPPVPLFRALKARTRKEIDWEKFTLKAMRGDFDSLTKQDVEKLLQTMKRV